MTMILRRVVPALVLAFGMAAVPAHASKKSKLLTTRTSHHLRLSGYQTLSAAHIGCGAGTVVWRARGSKVFHTATSRYFGKTKHGTYVCRKAALADHLHAAKG